MKKTIIFLVLLLSAALLQAQVKIAIVGSSTAFGAAATSNDSSWVGRLQAQFRRNMNAGDPDTLVYIKGGFGYNSYRTLPTGYTAPLAANRQPVDPNQNITAALADNPQVVIINLPSNDVAGYANFFWTPPYTIQETLSNFRVMRNAALAQGIPVFVATTQPRNDLDPIQRQMQKDMRDSILQEYGYYAINFWDTLTTNDGLFSLKDEFRNMGFPDADYHLNNAGHGAIYTFVRRKNLFVANSPLPTRLLSFQLRPQSNKAQLTWSTTSEEATTRFEIERSADGRQFQTVHTLPASRTGATSRYTWTDANPLNGRSFYRLRIFENGRSFYSTVLLFQLTSKPLTLLQTTANGSLLQLQVAVQQAGKATLQIVNASGAVVLREEKMLQAGTNPVSISIGSLAAGRYFIKILGREGSDQSSFQKLQ